QIVLIEGGCQHAKHHRDTTVQDPAPLPVFPGRPPQRADEIEQHLAKKPEKGDQPGDPSLSRILQIDVMQMAIPTIGRRLPELGWDETLELCVHLFRAESEPGMSFDHLPSRSTAEEPEPVRIRVAVRLDRGAQALAEIRRIEPE